jgi:hypothetical protein
MGDIEVKDHDGRIVITQRRDYDRTTGSSRYLVSLTLDEARAVAANLARRVALADELRRTCLE